MRTLLLALILLVPAGDPPRPGPVAPAEESLPEAPSATVRVVRAVAAVVRVNAAREADERLDGDALALACLRGAAEAADGDRTAFAVGLAHAGGAARAVAVFPGLRKSVAGAETPEEARARVRNLGRPALRGRHDLWLHWIGSLAVAAAVGPEDARVLGLAKEFADLRDGSGWSFVDLAADEAGIAVAEWLAVEPGARLGRLAAVTATEDLLPDPAGLEEGLDAEAFRERYERIGSEAWLRVQDDIRERTSALDLFEEPAADDASVETD